MKYKIQCYILSLLIFIFALPAFAQQKAPVPRFLPGDENIGNSVGGSSSGSNPSTFADGISAVGKLADTNKLAKAQSTKEILQTITKWLLSLVGTIAVISLLYGGYLYITSEGEEDKAEQAKNIILYSVIGIIVIGVSAIIVNVVISVATQ